MAERQDPVEWSRDRWIARDQPSPDQFRAMAAILRTPPAWTASIDATLRPYDLTRTGYLLMTTLLLSREGTRPLGQLSKQLMVHPTTVTLALDQLEKRGQLHRRPHPTDRRTVLAMLTRSGRELLDEVSRALAGTGFGLAGVDHDLASRVIDVLREVRGKIGDIPPG